jgi:hypothetical protein
MSGRDAADMDEVLESTDERLNGDAGPAALGAEPSAAGQRKRGLFPVRRRTLKRQLGELQAELSSCERQFKRMQAELQKLRGQLLERKRRLGQTERALEQETAQRAAAQASLQAREERLSAAGEHLAQLQIELETSERQRLQLHSALETAGERINQRERAPPEPRDALPKADAGGKRQGPSQPALPEHARPVAAKANQQQSRAPAGAADAAERPASEETRPPGLAARWRVQRRQGDQALHARYGNLLELSISGERTAELMRRLQRAAPELQRLAESLYPSR